MGLLSAKTELKEGKYSWFRGGAQAYLNIKKEKNNHYHISGDCYYGVSRKYGPNMGDLDFLAPLKNGKIIYKSKEKYIDYTFILTINKDNSFDVDEKGETTPFGHNATFYGHFTSDDLPSFSCEKVSSFVEHAICDTVKVARLDKKMARSYAQYKSAFFFEKEQASLEKKLRKEQKAWIQKRNKCEFEKAYQNCLTKCYTQRIKRLDKQFNSFWKYDD